MKIRIGFVSNSSSASFCLDKKYLSEEDIKKIKYYCTDITEKRECFDLWEIEETENTLKGYTVMDNGDLFNWMRKNIDIPINSIIHSDMIMDREETSGEIE